MFLGVHEDLHAEMYKSFKGKTAEELKDLHEKFQAAATKFVTGLEQLVPESGFVLGKETPTIADLALYDLVIAGTQASLSEMKFDMTPYPKINRIVEAVD